MKQNTNTGSVAERSAAGYYMLMVNLKFYASNVEFKHCRNQVHITLDVAG